MDATPSGSPTEAESDAAGVRPTGQPAPHSGVPTILLVGAALVCVLACLKYWHVQGLRNYLPDEGVYTYVGWSWLHGDWPYRDVWDHKGPIIFLVTLIRTAVLGNAPEMTGIQEIVMGLATAAVLGAAAWLLWGAIAASIVGVATTLFWTQLGPTGGHMSTAGSIIALLNALSILFALLAMRSGGRRRAWLLFTLGVSGGLAFLCKPNAIPGIAAAWLVLAWIGLRGGRSADTGAAGPGRVIRETGIIVAGAIAPMLVVAAIFAMAGDLSRLIEVAYVYNAKIRGPGILATLSPVGLAKKIAHGLARLHVLYAVGAAGLVSVIALAERFRRPDGGPVVADIEAIAPLWLAASLAEYASNGVYGHHVYTVLFPTAFALGWMLSITMRLLPTDRRVWALAIVIPLLARPTAELILLSASTRTTPPDWRMIGEHIKANTSPDQRVLAIARQWGPSTLAVSERRTAVRYIHSPALYNMGYTSNERWGEVVAALERADAPEYVVLSTFTLGDPPEAGPTVEWLAQSIDHAEAAGTLADPTPYPNRERTKQLLEQRYDIDICNGLVCALRLARPIGQ